MSELIEGDKVTDHRGNTGYARACVNSQTKQRFVGVFITDGPSKGTWGKPYHFSPVLDHEGGTLRTICEKCDRPFLATVRVERVGELESRNYPRQEKCRTCAGRQRTGAQRDRDNAAAALSDHQRKTKHHAVGT